jgi:NADH-quinone oxidoreductase subunit N
MGYVCWTILQLISIFLTGAGKVDSKSTESMMKTFMGSVVSQTFVLMGLGLLFLSSGGLDLTEIQRELNTLNVPESSMAIVFLCLVVGFGYPMAVLPAHLTAPDSYQGSSYVGIGYLGTTLRVGSLVFLLRVLLSVFVAPQGSEGLLEVRAAPGWPMILGIISGGGMLVGASVSLKSRSLKRWLSLIVTLQTGVWLLGVLVLDQVGMAALFEACFWDCLALWIVCSAMAWLSSGSPPDSVEELANHFKGKFYEWVVLGLVFAFFLGIPPFPTAVARFSILSAAFRHEYYGLASLGALAWLVSWISFIRVFPVPYFRTQNSLISNDEPVTGTSYRRLLLGSSVILILMILLAPWVGKWTSSSVHSVLW